MVINYLRENGYQGVIPEVLLTDEAHSFTVDSKDKETGAKREEKIGSENKNKVFTEEEWTVPYIYLKNFPRNTSVSMSISLSPLFTLYSIANRWTN